LIQQNVLIVDESQSNLVAISELVNKMGDCVPHVFLLASEALAWTRHNVPDLVIVDLMRGEIGLQFIERLRQNPVCALVPILMTTASDQKHFRYRSLDVGANDCLIKPVDKVEFLARAKNLLSLNRARRDLAARNASLDEEVRIRTQEVMDREQETVFRLSLAAEYRDPETGAHILRMANYSKLIARELGMSTDVQKLMLEAAPLHDIGKVGITDNILLKPGRLNPAEFEVMKKHASIGHELLNGSSSRVLQTGAEIALGHHEKFDGSGYPQGLRGQDIPIYSRIVAVADVFDALGSDRPYKRAWKDEAVLDFLQAGSGTHFDPECVGAFLNAWDDVEKIRSTFHEDIPAEPEDLWRASQIASF